MRLQQKSIEKLRTLINEETEYRTGPTLVSFFNALGFSDSYGQGFPSRWQYTENNLNQINGTKKIDDCVRMIFSPVNFIGRFEILDTLIKDFNQYLAFDGHRVERKGKDILIQIAEDFEISTEPTITEDEFINREFKDVSLEALGFEGQIIEILKERLQEIKKCFSAKACLSVIFMCGSTLEGILLGVATKNARRFNEAKASPKDKDGNVRPLAEWKLSSLIDVSCELGLIGDDVKKFSHALRGFRNYIHPYQQLASRFNPDTHTAKICWQVLQAAIAQLSRTVA